MLLAVGEYDQFSLYAGAISRSDALDLSVVEGRIFKALAQRIVHLLVGIARPARKLLQRACIADERKAMIVGFTGFYAHIFEMDGPSVYSHGGTGLHP